MELLNEYQNGNYKVAIYDDGTKVRETEEDAFVSSFPECMDLKITNKCDMGCAYCHEDSTIDGKHGDILNAEFINTLHPFTELALGGGNVLSHPDLLEFLQLLKSKNIIANITINQEHFIKHRYLVKYLVDKDLIKGLGVSLTNPTDEFIELVKLFPNAVIHVINGVVTMRSLEKLFNNNLKILILGYKEFRRGKDYYSKAVEFNKIVTHDNLPRIIKGFKVVSFDNLAIKQLDVRRLMSKRAWEQFYMGDDGQFTMYVDLVEKKFARNSTSVKRYDLLDNIVDMFNVVKAEDNNKVKEFINNINNAFNRATKDGKRGELQISLYFTYSDFTLKEITTIVNSLQDRGYKVDCTNDIKGACVKLNILKEVQESE